MSREVSTNGRKKVSTLMKEFNANFPYLLMHIGTMDAEKTFHRCDIEKTLSEVRTKKGSGEISFTGSKNIGTIEREFLNIFGLTVQIMYYTSECKRVYTTGSGDSKSLTQLNREKAEAGCQKDKWN